MRCECADCLCPVNHGRECHETAAETLYRTDMIDEYGTPFCAACGRDALESGIFCSVEG